jgi:hypothetical protein
MSLKLANNAVSKLASAIAAGDTSISVTAGDGAKFPALAAGDWFPITAFKSDGSLEIMRCTALAGDTLTVSRAQEGTAALAFNVGTIVELRLTAAAVAEIQSNISTNTTQLGQISGKNRLINGGFKVDQRNSGAAQTIVAGAALAYTVDRWYAYCTGANVTGQRVAGSGRSQYRYQFTGVAGCTGIGFAQRIEAANSYDLNGETATLSVDLANSLLGTVTWTAYYANTADAFGTLAAPTRTQIATGTFNVTNAVTRYSTQIAIPAAATTGIEIVLSVGAQTSGTWTIGEPQLEHGSIATEVDRPILSDVLQYCQRYCFKIASSTACDIAMGMINSSTSILADVDFPVEMFAAPTLLSSNLYGSSAAQITAVTSSSIGSVSTRNARISTTASGATWTPGQVGILIAGNGSGGWIQLTAEIP